MKTKKVQVDIPLHMHSHLQQIADASTKPLEEVVLQCLKNGLPPSLHKVPAAFHDELIGLNRLDDRTLLRIVEGEWPAAERQDEAHKKADFATLRRTYALSLLRWRGHPVPIPYDTFIT